MERAVHGAGARGLAISDTAVRRDRLSARRANLGTVLRLLRDEGPRARMTIAADTGLPRTTVANLVAELLDGGLVAEGEPEREGALGRPALSVGIAGTDVHGIGVEVNVDHVSLLALNLRGEVAMQWRRAIDVRAESPAVTLDLAARLVEESVDALCERGGRAVGVTLATPGIVDADAGVVRYAANIGWRDVPAVAGLRSRLAAGSPSQLRLENDAKLGALAEYVPASARGVHDLVYVTGQFGVGVGIIAGGRLVRGAAGYAGEVGHLPLGAPEDSCACGRRGCWETAVGLGALLRLAADPDDPVRDQAIDLEQRLQELVRRAERGSTRTRTALDGIGRALGPGVALLAEVLNPGLLVLGGHFAAFGDLILEPVRAHLGEKAVAPQAGGCDVALSVLGLTAAARGGAYLALGAVYEDPIAVLRYPGG